MESFSILLKRLLTNFKSNQKFSLKFFSESITELQKNHVYQKGSQEDNDTYDEFLRRKAKKEKLEENSKAIKLLGTEETKENNENFNIEAMINKKKKALDDAQYSGATSFVKNLISDMSRNNRVQFGGSDIGEVDHYGRKRMISKTNNPQNKNSEIQETNAGPIIRGNIEYKKVVQTKDAITEPDHSIFNLEKVLRDNSEFKNILEYFNNKATELKKEKAHTEELYKNQVKKLKADNDNFLEKNKELETDNTLLKREIEDLINNKNELNEKIKAKRTKYRKLKNEFETSRTKAISNMDGLKEFEDLKMKNEFFLQENKKQKIEIVKLRAMLKILQGKLREALNRKKEMGTKEIRYSISVDQNPQNIQNIKSREDEYMDEDDLSAIDSYDIEQDPDRLYVIEDILENEELTENNADKLIQNATKQLESQYFSEFNEVQIFDVQRRDSLINKINENLEEQKEKQKNHSKYEFKLKNELTINDKMELMNEKRYQNDESYANKIAKQEEFEARKLESINKQTEQKKLLLQNQDSAEKAKKTEASNIHKIDRINEDYNQIKEKGNETVERSISSSGKKFSSETKINNKESSSENLRESQITMQKKLKSEIKNSLEVEYKIEKVNKEDKNTNKSQTKIVENIQSIKEEMKENNEEVKFHFQRNNGPIKPPIMKQYDNSNKIDSLSKISKILFQDKIIQTELTLNMISEIFDTKGIKSSGIYNKIKENNYQRNANTSDIISKTENASYGGDSQRKLAPLRTNDRSTKNQSLENTGRSEILMENLNSIKNQKSNFLRKKIAGNTLLSKSIIKTNSNSNLNAINDIVLITSSLDSSESLILAKNNDYDKYFDMYNSFIDMLKNNPSKLKNIPLLEEILKTISLNGLEIPDYEKFLAIIGSIESKHKECGGEICEHLKRFYEKLGFKFNQGSKKTIVPHKRNLNHFPKLMQKMI